MPGTCWPQPHHVFLPVFEMSAMNESVQLEVNGVTMARLRRCCGFGAELIGQCGAMVAETGPCWPVESGIDVTRVLLIRSIFEVLVSVILDSLNRSSAINPSLPNPPESL